jgi:Tol biopolymer transport system component
MRPYRDRIQERSEEMISGTQVRKHGLTLALVLVVVAGVVAFSMSCETTNQAQDLTKADSGGYTTDIDEPSTRGMIQRVSPTNLHVTWRFTVSSDQQDLVFSGYQSQNQPVPDLWKVPAAGGAATKITSGSSEGAYSPSYTADGKFIVYESSGALWMVRRDGAGGKRRIPGSGVGQDVAPDVSAKDVVCFTSVSNERDPSTGEVSTRWIIWTSDLNGGSLTQLREGKYPRWSPDGTTIVFEHLGDIWTISADGTALTQLTSTKEIVEGLPSFSPDGKSIVYVSNEIPGKGGGGDINLWVMDRDGSRKIQVTELKSWDSWPIWTPSGMFFLSGRANDQSASENYVRIWHISKTDWTTGQ